MKKPQLIQRLRASLLEDGSDANLRQWAQYIITHKVDLALLLPLLHADKPVAARFAWLMGGLCEQAPAMVAPCVGYCYSHRNDIKVANFERSLAKMFLLAGVPEDIEGAVIDDLFKWLADPKAGVYTKDFAMLALHKLASKYPELNNELRLAIEDQLKKNTQAFEKER